MMKMCRQSQLSCVYVGVRSIHHRVFDVYYARPLHGVCWLALWVCAGWHWEGLVVCRGREGHVSQLQQPKVAWGLPVLLGIIMCLCSRDGVCDCVGVCVGQITHTASPTQDAAASSS